MTELRTPPRRGRNLATRADRLFHAYAVAMSEADHARAALIRRAWWRIAYPAQFDRWERVTHV